MLNRGVNGEETAQMMARFEAAVLAARPDLVLWQVGTNSVMRDHSLAAHAILLREGLARIVDGRTVGDERRFALRCRGYRLKHVDTGRDARFYPHPREVDECMLVV